jgi:5-hydroxyisourate hydrolase
MLIELWSLDLHIQRRSLLKVLRTNDDGRTEEPLLIGDALTVGIYELVFAVGDYFAAVFPTQERQQPPFLDRVPVRFGVADPNADYHVPLIVSPWSYSTYRVS